MSIKNEANSISALSVISFLVVLLFALSASGGPTPESPSNEKKEILRHIREKHKNTHAIRAAVYQDKELAALKDPVHVEGTVILEKPGLLRWEAHVPEQSVTIIDRKTIQIYYPDDKEAEIHKLSDHFIARNTMTFFGSVMWGEMENLEKRFAVSMHQDEGELLIQLEPHSKIVSRYLSSIIIRYDSQTGMPRGFEVTTPKGDRTVTRIEELTVNPEIDTDAFTLKLPPDVRVRDYTVTLDTN
jgi:outer membrane lipoprotein-sorting protein